MGHNPIPPARRIVLESGGILTLPYVRRVPERWRRSFFPWRRRAAIAACRARIFELELEFGWLEIKPPPKPSRVAVPTYR